MNQSPLSIETHHTDSLLLVAVGGELDLSTVPEFEAAVAAAISERPAGNVVIDCADLQFIDSAGLAAWVRLGQQHDLRVALTGAHTKVIRLIEISGLKEILPDFPDLEAATAWLEAI